MLDALSTQGGDICYHSGVMRIAAQELKADNKISSTSITSLPKIDSPDRDSILIWQPWFASKGGMVFLFGILVVLQQAPQSQRKDGLCNNNPKMNVEVRLLQFIARLAEEQR